MKNKILTILIVFSLFVLVNSVSASSNITVNRDDTDNIQNIIDDAEEGSTITFDNGNYEGISFKINKSMNIQGNGKANFIYSEKNSYEYMIHIGNTSIVNIMGINFIGIEYDGWFQGYMIMCENSSNIQISNCKFKNMEYGISIGTWLYDDRDYDGKNITIYNNSFENYYLGIDINYIDNIKINTNNFKGGLWGNSIVSTSCNNTKIIENNFTNNTGACIYSRDSNLTIEKNKITKCRSAPINIEWSNAKINYNNITDNIDEDEYYGPFPMIYISDSNATITNNIILNNRNKTKEETSIAYAITLKNMENVKIDNNLISNNSAGISIENQRWDDYGFNNNINNDSEIYIHNNNIINNDFNGIKFVGIKNGMIEYNNISNNGKYGIMIVFSSQCNISYNNITKNKGYGILLSDYDDNYDPIPALIRMSNPVYYRGNSTYCKIYNNNILNNKAGIVLEGEASFNLIKRNIIYNNDLAGVIINRSSCFNNITGNDFEGNRYGILIDMYGNDTDYEWWDPEDIPDISVNNTIIDYNRFYKNNKTIFILNNDNKYHGNIALSNWFGTNNPEEIEGIDNQNWFIVEYNADYTNVKVGETVKVTYNIRLNDGSSGNSMLLPYFKLIVKDYGGNTDNIFFSKFLNSEQEYDARVSTSFFKTFANNGTFYSNANIDGENILLTFNVIGSNKIDPIDPIKNDTDKNNKTNDNDNDIDNNNNISDDQNKSNVKSSMAKTGSPITIILAILGILCTTLYRKK